MESDLKKDMGTEGMEEGETMQEQRGREAMHVGAAYRQGGDKQWDPTGLNWVGAGHLLMKFFYEKINPFIQEEWKKYPGNHS